MRMSDGSKAGKGDTTLDRIERAGSGYQKRRRVRRWIAIAKLLADATAYASAWLLAWWIRTEMAGVVDRPLNPDFVYLQSLPFIVTGSLITSAAVGSFSPRQNHSAINDAMRTVKSALGSLLVVMSLAFLVKEYDFSRAIVLLFGGFSILFLPIARKVVSLFEERLVKLGIVGTRVLIIGAGEIGIRALQKVHDHPEIGYRVLGFLDDDPAKQNLKIGRTPVLGVIGSLRNTILAERVDEVIFAIPTLGQRRLMALVMTIDDLPVRTRVVADLFGVLSRETQIDAIEDVPIYDLKGPDVSAWYRLTKRLFDFTVVLPAGVIFALTLPIIALAIKLDSRGPVFFIHDRSGKEGKLFSMWKFRTMSVESDPYSVSPNNKTDPRITRVGAFLRKTSLDELPQVVNVIAGSMSIVGPRPEMPFIVDTYNDWQRKRLDVTPGITGLWQIM